MQKVKFAWPQVMCGQALQEKPGWERVLLETVTVGLP